MNDPINTTKAIFATTALFIILSLGIWLLFFTQKSIRHLIKLQRAMLLHYRDTFTGEEDIYLSNKVNKLEKSYFLLRNPQWKEKSPWWLLVLLRFTGFWFVVFSLLMLGTIY